MQDIINASSEAADGNKARDTHVFRRRGFGLSRRQSAGKTDHRRPFSAKNAAPSLA